MVDLNALALADAADIDTIGAALDTISHNDRVGTVRSTAAAAQRALWALCEGRDVSLADMVPDGLGPLEPVIHFGKNSLPVFTVFEKRFCRPSDPAAHPDVLWGYNEGLTRAVVGPGYFVVRSTPGDARGSTVIDYEQIPPEKPERWPAVRSNERGLCKMVYGSMHDFMRRISRHVTIGRAYRHGNETPNYFLLCREG